MRIEKGSSGRPVGIGDGMGSILPLFHRVPGFGLSISGPEIWFGSILPFCDGLPGWCGRGPENWLGWIVVDQVSVALFWSREMYLTAGLYALFLGMCAAGLVEWRRHLGRGDA